MFSRQSNASKVAFVYLAEKLLERGFGLIDCQLKTEHLMQFGAREIPGAEFQDLLAKSVDFTNRSKWLEA
jgi:leucyl/phenylalanyl-tRNA--protein transferase